MNHLNKDYLISGFGYTFTPEVMSIPNNEKNICLTLIPTLNTHQVKYFYIDFENQMCGFVSEAIAVQKYYLTGQQLTDENYFNNIWKAIQNFKQSNFGSFYLDIVEGKHYIKNEYNESQFLIEAGETKCQVIVAHFNKQLIVHDILHIVMDNPNFICYRTGIKKTNEWNEWEFFAINEDVEIKKKFVGYKQPYDFKNQDFAYLKKGTIWVKYDSKRHRDRNLYVKQNYAKSSFHLLPAEIVEEWEPVFSFKPMLKLTLEQIAKKFDVDVDNLTIIR